MKNRAMNYFGACALMATGLVAAGAAVQAEGAVTGTYAMVVDSFDPAAYSTDIILTLDQAIDAVTPALMGV